MPFLTGYVIDEVIKKADRTKLNAICLALIVVTLIYQGLSYAVDFLRLRIQKSVTIRYRLKLLRHLQSLPLLYLADKEVGYLASRLVGDPSCVTDLVMQVIDIGVSLATLGIGVAAIFIIDVRLAAISISIVPFFALPYVIFQKRVRAVDNQQKEQNAIISKGLFESIRAIPLVKLFLLQAGEGRRFLGNMRRELELSLRAFNYDYAVSASAGFFAALGPLIVVWYGGLEVMDSRLTIGQLVAFSSLLAFIFGPTKSIVGSNLNYLRAFVSLNRVYDILERDRESDGVSGKCDIRQKFSFDIEFRDVSFSYEAGPSTLVGINLRIKGREKVAIVGPTGAGKSTLLSLLPRFYAPATGEIIIGGENIAAIPIRRLRSWIGVVTQDPFLFCGSIYDNILIGNRKATYEDVVRASERANALHFIRLLDKGFEAQVGENGQFLSGGQKQLICLARVILRDSPILILDEPTSAIDSKTERLMHESLASFVQDRTTLIVSHRLSTILNVDRVVVLESGRISATGSHSEVLTKSKFYESMIALHNVEFSTTGLQ